MKKDVRKYMFGGEAQQFNQRGIYWKDAIKVDAVLRHNTAVNKFR